MAMWNHQGDIPAQVLRMQPHVCPLGLIYQPVLPSGQGIFLAHRFPVYGFPILTNGFEGSKVAPLQPWQPFPSLQEEQKASTKKRFDYKRLADEILKEQNDRFRTDEVSESQLAFERHYEHYNSKSQAPLTSGTELRDQRRKVKGRPKKHHICRYCGRNFSKSYNCSIHERIHTDERPFRCSICNKFFRRLDHLKSHQSTHTKEKRFKCKDCDRAFSDNRYLASHHLVHLKDPTSQSGIEERSACSGAVQKESGMTEGRSKMLNPP